MRIAVVTSSFEPDHPGGVTNVAIRLIDLIKNSLNGEISVISFPSSRDAKNSVQFFRPSTYFAKIVEENLKFETHKLIRIGTVGSEFEFLRYRKRRELKTLFSQFDIIIVVTGFLQFANVIPAVHVPIFVQCATRLTWERESQYSGMSFFKRFVLKAQIPLLALQEFRVVRSEMNFVPENLLMYEWLENRTRSVPKIWYPGIASPHKSAERRRPDLSMGPFISVGRFGDRRKGWARLIESYVKAFDMKNNFPELVLIGWGQFDDLPQGELKEIQSKYPIKIFANLSNLERDNMLRSSSIFVQASFEEGLGLAAIEALSFGLPIVASETNGSREYVVPGINGERVPQGKYFVDKFARTLINACEWDLEQMSYKSTEIFETKFEKRISESKFLEILQPSQP